LSVRVLEVDLVRKRIALSAKRGGDSQSVGGAGVRAASGSTSGQRPDQNRGPRSQPGRAPSPSNKPQAPAPGFKNNPFADHFRK
jgi:uncharacterized protein